LWWSSSPEIDKEITNLFKDDLNKLDQGVYNAWKEDRDGKLAAVLLADQFSRNIYRKQKQAFEYDHISLAISKSL
jgi:uncharacterized protein (DUF924 family)